jgi:phosphoglycolate phosphatase-like HAD superfamily hydrolase
MKKQLVLNVGVADLLRILARSPTHVIGVLTGNVAAVGKEKLIATGIMQFFSEEFYADQYFDRNQLVRDAVDSCKTRYKLSSRRNVVVIGDTPLDISAANSAGATSIGIAGGLYSLSQLRRARAAWVFPNLKPTKQLLDSLGLGQIFPTR